MSDNTFSQYEWPKTDFSQASIDLSEIVSGGPPKDGIPAIDSPLFVDQDSANKWLDSKEPVIVLTVNGETKAYPIQILIYHEIVNDSLGGIPVSITFCPLCNAAIVFDRRLDGLILDFGTTGRLRKSDMLMYDRQTESWWQQFIGEAVIGKLTGQQLKQFPATIVAYQEFKMHFPAAKILSQKTGYSRPYGNNPYQGYDKIGQQPFLFFDPLDQRLPAMERVLGVQVNKSITIYPLSRIEELGTIMDKIDGTNIVVMSKSDMFSPLDKGTIKNSKLIPAAKAYFAKTKDRELTFKNKNGKLIDIQTGSNWSIFGKAIDGPLKGRQLASADSGVHFAFAWLAFRPNSKIYGQ